VAPADGGGGRELIGVGDPSPIDRPGRSPAVLAIHGFGGTPLEVELVVEVAQELGLRAHAPLLPGHGTTPAALARTRFPDWRDAALAALDRVSSPGVPAIVVGLSLGSLLAAYLAATRPSDVRALGMLANAVRLQSPFPDLALRAVDRLGLPDFDVPKAAGPDIGDPVARATHLTYRLQPVQAAIAVLRTGEAVEPLLERVTAPAFIAHGQNDRVCPVSNAERVARRLGSTDRTVVILPRSHHIVTRDFDRDLLRAELRKFLARFA
jgi:carboxylesterase